MRINTLNKKTLFYSFNLILPIKVKLKNKVAGCACLPVSAKVIGIKK